MPEGRAISGARSRLEMGGKQIGFATGVSAQEVLALVPVEVLGEIDVLEYEVTGRTVSMSMSRVRIKRRSLREVGIWPRGETPDVIEFPSFTAVLMDKIDNTPIISIEGVKPETMNFSIDRAGIMMENATFRGLRMFDELDS